MGFMALMLLLMTPVLTMGLLAQERSSGTIELLMTRPVRDWEIVIGKYLGSVGLVFLILIPTLQFPLIIELAGDPDWGIILAGYLGVILAVMAFISLGLFASSLTANHIAAGVIALFLLLFLWFIGVAAHAVSQNLGDLFKHISFVENLRDFSKGIIDTKAIIYFASLIGYALLATERSLGSRRAA